MNITSIDGHLPPFYLVYVQRPAQEEGKDGGERKETSSRKNIKKYKWTKKVDK
jgi:hypothetical protein